MKTILIHRKTEIRDRIYAFYHSQGKANPEFRFNVIKFEDGTKIHDIRTAQENAAFANHLVEVVADAVKDPHTTIHMSLAGGRKTMSSYALSVMMLFARERDRLSHVLVEPASLEGNPDFWWPGQPQETVITRERKTISTREEHCTVTLVPVPFLRLSEAISDPGNTRDHLRLIENANDQLKPRRIIVDFKARTICCPPEPAIKLNAAQFSIYAMLATARAESWPGAGPDGLGTEEAGFVSHFSLRASQSLPKTVLAQYYEQTWDKYRGKKYLTALKDPDQRLQAAKMFTESFSQLRTKIQREDLSFWANKALNPTLIPDRSGKGRFGLSIAPNLIERTGFPEPL